MAELKRQLDEWRAFRARLMRLRDAAGASGMLDPMQLQARVAALDDQILRLNAATSRAPTGETIAAALTRLRGHLETVRRAVATRRRLLQGLSDLPERHAAQTAALGSTTELLAQAHAHVSRRRSTSESADAAAVAARTASETAASEVTRLRTELAALDTIRVDMEAAAAADRQIAEMTAQKAGTEAALEKVRADLAAAQAQAAAGRERTEELARGSATAAAAAQLAELARGLSGLSERARLSSDAAVRLKVSAETASGEFERLTTARNRIEEEHDAAQAALAIARNRATAMASAVAQIASHLHDDDTDCPVCRSHFPVGALRRLAQELAGAQSAELTLAEANGARRAASLAETARAIAQAEAAITAAANAQRTAEADVVTLRQQEERVRSGLPEGVKDLLDGAVDAETRANTAFSQASAAVSTSAADVAQATLQLETLPPEISNLERRLADLTATASALDVDRRNRLIRVAAAGHADTLPEDLATRVAVGQTDLVEAEATQHDARAAAETAREASSSARVELDASTRAAAALEAARASSAEAVAALEDRWREAGVDGVPTAAVLEAALTAVSQRAADVERLEDERAELVTANDLADRDEELRILIRQMEDIGGTGAAEDSTPREVGLAKDLAHAEEVHRNSLDAQAAVRALSEKLRDEAATFSTQFLEPLNDLIEGFNEALLSTPGDSVRFQADNRVDTTHFEMGLQYRDRLEDALFNKELPPQVILSEGQLAANGFSILCAASTAYPWSRWRSLLLDDPLQHNDIIHAAAFVDLMRNLVELERYQLLMSSHDRGEAEFIARKFEAAGLACKVIALTAPSSTGVRYEEPPPNSAARTLLESTKARSA